MMYHRYTHTETPISDYAGFGMFAKNEGRVSSGYGTNHFAYDGRSGVDINEMKDRIIDAWEDFRDCAPDYMQDMDPEEFFKAFDPDDIVDDAEAWDNEDFRRFFYDYIYEDEKAILLSTAAIVFDEELVIFD